VTLPTLFIFMRFRGLKKPSKTAIEKNALRLDTENLKSKTWTTPGYQ
jgi:hypothetical protein